jgi:hypothetical protein
MEREIVLQPKQALLRKLADSPATWLGYGGARGGGKSGAIRRLMLLRRIKYPGTFGVILRRVWDDVLKNHVEKFKQEFPELTPLYANKEYALPNRSKIMFLAAENADDVKRKFVGPEYMDVFVDQAEQFSEKELRDIKMACRWPGMPENACKLGLFYNPGGDDPKVAVLCSAFLKRIFYDRKFQGKERAEDFAFVHAYGWDNVEWCKPALIEDGCTEENYETEFNSWDFDKRFEYFVTRSQYGRDLDAMPEHIRIGHLLGRFDRFAGQYFGAVWDREKVAATPAQLALLVKPWWKRWLSLDWGFFHNTGILWWARGKVTARELRQATGLDSKQDPIDLIVTYKSMMTEQDSETRIAEEIVANCDENERKTIKHFFIGPIGPERKRKIGHHTVPQQIGAVMRKYGMPEPVVADDERVAGWRLMYNELRATQLCARLAN